MPAEEFSANLPACGVGDLRGDDIHGRPCQGVLLDFSRRVPTGQDADAGLKDDPNLGFRVLMFGSVAEPPGYPPAM